MKNINNEYLQIFQKIANSENQYKKEIQKLYQLIYNDKARIIKFEQEED